MLRQPRRPRRLRSDLLGLRLAAGRRPSRRRRADLRLGRLRPARCRLQQARPVLPLGLRRLRPAQLRPAHPGHRALLAAQVEAVRPRLRDSPAAAPARPPQDHRHRRRHGEPAQGARRAEDQLLRLLLRHLPRPDLRHAAPAPGPPPGDGRRRRPEPHAVPVEPRPGRGVQQDASRCTSAGWPSTTRSSASARRGARCRGASTGSAQAGPLAGRRGHRPRRAHRRVD